VNIADRFLRGYHKQIYKAQAVLIAFLNGGKLSMLGKYYLAVPLRCDGAGSVTIGKHVSLGFAKAPKLGSGLILLQARNKLSSITIGDRTVTSNNISIISCLEVTIGEDCQIGDQVAIYDCDFHEISPEKRTKTAGEIIPVKIGKNVWLGSRVMVLKGVTIGEHSVIAAGSIVTKSIPVRCLAAGVPAVVIRKI
jgi:maltose O-acetyltransferase